MMAIGQLGSCDGSVQFEGPTKHQQGFELDLEYLLQYEILAY